MTEEQKTKVIGFTKDYYKWSLKKDDGFCIERYVDYRDEFLKSTIKKILECDSPLQAFDEIVMDWDIDCDDWYYETEFFNQLETFCNENGIDKDGARDVVIDNFYWTYPDSFLNPTFKAVIEIDTGDGNYDFTLHNVCNYASNYGYKQNSRGGLDKLSGLYWLAKQQKRLGLLQKNIISSDHYHNGDCKESKFVSSCITELVNLPTNIAALTFLVEMDLQTAIKIMQNVREHANNKDFNVYHPQDTKGCPFGYVVLGKETETGLFDRWNGSGSPFEIELERDVKIPLHFINGITTDDWIQKVYGMTSECWKNSLKKVA